MPFCVTNAAASRREWTSSLPSTFWMCVRAVSGLITRCCAMPSLSAPCASSARTSRSRRRELRHPLQRLVALAPPVDQPLQERTEHPRRDQRVAAMDGSRGVDQVDQRRALREVAARAGLQRLDQQLLVLLRAEHDDPTIGDPQADLLRRADAVAVGQTGVEQGDVGPHPLDLGDRLEAVGGLADDDEVVFAREHDLDRLPEQRLLVGEQHADHSVPLGHAFPSISGASTVSVR